MKLTLVIAAILLSMKAYTNSSPWTSESRSFLSQVEFPYPDRFASSLKSICRLNPPKWKKMDLKIEDQIIPHPEFLKKGMWIKSGFQQKKAPLMIILPGAFSTMGGPQARYLANKFIKMGYHILLLPNPWGESYIKYAPLHPTGHLLKEGESLQKFLLIWRTQLSPEKRALLGKVSILGISYGAFASTMIAARDAKTEDPVITGSVFAISPPIQMAKTMLNLDDSIISIADRIHEGKLSFLGAYRRLCRSNNQSELSQKDMETIKVITVKIGFHQNMIKNIVDYSDVFDLNWYPRRGPFRRSAYNEWQYSTIFQSYFEEYAPIVGNLTRSQYGNIQYWIDENRRSGKNNIKVLVSKDDFLNSISDNDQEYSEFNDPAYVTIPHGGHFGFADQPWFNQLIKDLYSLKAGN